MDKKQLVERVAARTGLPKKMLKQAYEEGFKEIMDAVAGGEKATFKNFGTFEQKQRNQKVGTSPITHERIVIQEKLIPNFRPSEKFEKEVDPTRFSV